MWILFFNQCRCLRWRASGLVSRLREQTIAQSQTSSIIQPRIINTVKPRPELVSDHTESPSIAVARTCLCGRVSITPCERLCYVVGPPDKEDPEPIKATVGSAEPRQNKARAVCNCDNLWEVLTRSSKSQKKWTKVETQLRSTLGAKYAHTCCHLCVSTHILVCWEHRLQCLDACDAKQHACCTLMTS